MQHDAESTPHWFLISVLFSSLPLTPQLATRLHKAAFDLYRADDDALEVRGTMLKGEVRNLKKQLLLGTIAGHAFEARLDTERGEGVVRYLLTDEGIEAFAKAQPRTMLN
jgi:hypothetical protein